MNPNDREFIESPIYQGEDEKVSYNLTTTSWGGSPTSVSMKLYQMNKNAKTDVSATKLSGSPSVVGDVITTPYIISLTDGVKYRLEASWMKNGNTVEAFGYIYGQV